MLQSIEEKASNYASSLQTLETEILKDVKKLKACKQQRMKKFFDRVSFLQKEVEGSVSEVRSQLIQYRIVGSFVYGQLCWAGSNLFVGRLGRATWTIHQINSHTSQEGIKCIKAKEWLRTYCPSICIVGIGQGVIKRISGIFRQFIWYWLSHISYRQNIMHQKFSYE